MSNYIFTHSRTKFYPLNPVESDININDIAHSLSLLSRANGHFRHFYSVAQHSVNCSLEAKNRDFSERVQLGCLLHDASESYIADVTRPVKLHLTEYSRIEETLQNMIYKKFGLSDLSETEMKQIKLVDDALLHYEFLALLDIELCDTAPYISMEHQIGKKDFTVVENKFIRLFNRLTTNRLYSNCIGVDGCKDGWLVVNIMPDSFEVDIYKNIGEICKKYPKFDSMLIDIPIGLPESTDDIRPDAEARKQLYRRASSIFNTPCRQALDESYTEANHLNKVHLGKGLSRQSFSIFDKIREVDKFLEQTPDYVFKKKGSKPDDYVNKIVESHPEICFEMLSPSGLLKDGLRNTKSSDEGKCIRIDILKEYFHQTAEFMRYVRNDIKLCKVEVDCIDALCLAVTGILGRESNFTSIPKNPYLDRQGILMQMVYSQKE